MSRSLKTRSLVSSNRSRIGGNPIRNAAFAVVPTGTTPTTAGRRWIDGTAGGSTTNDAYSWGTNGNTAGSSAVFDDTEPYDGHPTLKLALGGANQQIAVYNTGSYDTLSYMQKYGIRLPNVGFYFNFYTLTWKMKTNFISGDANTAANAGYSLFTGSGGFVGGNSGLGNTNGLGIKTTQDWNEYSYTFQLTSSNQARFIEPFVQIKGNDGAATLVMEAWFTDLRLIPNRPITRSFA